MTGAWATLRCPSSIHALEIVLKHLPWRLLSDRQANFFHFNDFWCILNQKFAPINTTSITNMKFAKTNLDLVNSSFWHFVTKSLINITNELNSTTHQVRILTNIFTTYQNFFFIHVSNNPNNIMWNTKNKYKNNKIQIQRRIPTKTNFSLN